MSKKYTYLGRGKTYLQAYGSTDPLLFVGNVSKLDFSPQEDEQSVRDYTRAGAGKYDSVRTITGVQIAMTQWDLSPDNLKRALRGTSAAVTSSVVTAEVHTARLGGLIDLDKIPDPAIALVVKDSTDTTTYTLGTDYERTSSGLIPLVGGTITEGSTLHIGYTSLLADVVQALLAPSLNFRLVFEGLNEADSGKPVIVRVHNAKFGTLQNLPLIGDGFASVDVTGDALADTTITDSALSQYFTITRAA